MSTTLFFLVLDMSMMLFRFGANVADGLFRVWGRMSMMLFTQGLG